DAHHAGLSLNDPVRIAHEHGLEQPRTKVVELHARIANAGDLDDHVAAHVKTNALGQPEQVHATRRHVLAELSGGDVEARVVQLVEQLGMEQVHLPQVR